MTSGTMAPYARVIHAPAPRQTSDQVPGSSVGKAPASGAVPYSTVPQPGAQWAFLATPADIAVYGGAAGAGKSFALLMEPLRKMHVPGFGAVIFRRTYPQITNEGGLWDTSNEMYVHCGASARQSTLEWVFPGGNRIKFAHMQYEKDRYEWDGAQIPLIGFDQLEHFTWRQFFYMLSRNRSMCGVIPYVRATCNPDPDHWLRDFMRWWIHDDTGLPITGRSGVIRWFVIVNGHTYWADSAEELILSHGDMTRPKSFTFVPGNVRDNKILLDQNPEYLPNLEALPKVDRARLLHGNWNVRETAGTFFQGSWFEVVDVAPPLVAEVRYWDRAATAAEDAAASRASWTAGVRMGVDARGMFHVTHVERFQGSPLDVETKIKNVASQDGVAVQVILEQDPGQAGKAEAQLQVRNLAGYNATVNAVHESKGTRAKPLSAQAEAGNVKLLRAPWNDAYIREMENFDGSKTCASDQVDASSGAFHMLTSVKRAGTWGRK